VSSDGVVRFGVIGAGRVARDFAVGLRFVPDASLVAVASRTRAVAERFAADFAGTRLLPTVDALVEDESIDVVYVATPHHLHAEQTTLSLQAGKAVLCEKPFTIDATEAREVVAAARRHQRFCMEAMWTRFIPIIQRAKEIVDGGGIGQPRMLHADFGVPTTAAADSRFYDPAQGGGALLDRGVYGVSLAVMLFGRPVGVAAVSGISATGVDEHTGILLRFEGDSLAVLSCSLSSLTSGAAWVSGSEGSLTVHAPFYCPERLTVRRYQTTPPAEAAPQSRRDAVVAMAKGNVLGRAALRLARPVVSRTRRSEVHTAVEGNGYGYEVAEVVRCLRSGALESERMPLDESVTIMEVLDTVRAESARARA
jgi:predicted dehydrogenase